MSELTHPKDVFYRRDEVQIVDCRETSDGSPAASRRSASAERHHGRWLGDLDAGEPVVVVCRSGNRSELATLMLQARGFDAHNLEGGMEEWERAGLPFTTPDGAPGRVA
jgi:rhodanese-related sulfurtransferase